MKIEGLTHTSLIGWRPSRGAWLVEIKSNGAARPHEKWMIFQIKWKIPMKSGRLPIRRFNRQIAGH